jgi:DNA (cytosine-5)-methyltransferase 1
MTNTNNNRKKNNRIPILSFFTGGGFLDMGFEQSGFNIVWTNEINTIFADMYCFGTTKWRHSFYGEAKVAKISDTRDIELVSTSEILHKAFPKGRPNFFGIIGGPPCPDFSSGGKHRGGNGMNGRLSMIYVQTICKIKPYFFVFENVPGLYKTKIHREFLRNLELHLERNNYCLDLKIINSLDFGVPQDRERLFMIGIKKRIVKKCIGRTVCVNERGWFSWPKPQYEYAKSKYSWPDIVKRGKMPSKPRNVPKELTVNSILNSKNDPSKLPNGLDFFKPHSEKFLTIREGDTHRKSFKKLHRHRFRPTVCYGHNEVHLHPWKKRRLSVREAMRIQGIPDEYILPEDKPLSDKFTFISNGVPVPLSFAVANSLQHFFENKY